MAESVKFRAWAGDQWLDHDESVSVMATFGSMPGDAEITLRVGVWGTSRDCILMLATGAADKDGREIYEGDIVAWNGEPFEVRRGCAQWNLHSPLEGQYPLIVPKPEVLEIIGNIYEHAVLMSRVP